MKNFLGQQNKLFPQIWKSTLHTVFKDFSMIYIHSKSWMKTCRSQEKCLSVKKEEEENNKIRKL